MVQKEQTAVIIKDISIVKRTAVEFDHPVGHEIRENSQNRMVNIDEPYDLTKEEDRMDLMRKMAGDFYRSIHYDNHMFNKLAEELTAVMKEFKEELPFD